MGSYFSASLNMGGVFSSTYMQQYTKGTKIFMVDIFLHTEGLLYPDKLRHLYGAPFN